MKQGRLFEEGDKVRDVAFGQTAEFVEEHMRYLLTVPLAVQPIFAQCPVGFWYRPGLLGHFVGHEVQCAANVDSIIVLALEVAASRVLSETCCACLWPP
jgi:hypothetical protein